MSAKYINPLSKGASRNKICICGSGEKVKKCCGRDAVISKDKLDQINGNFKRIREEFDKVIKDQSPKGDSNV